MKRSEDVVMKYVLAGDLSIDKTGRVWRHRKRVGGAAHNIYDLEQPVRAENKTKAGYLQIVVCENGQRIGCQAHRLIWYSHNGSIPKNCIIHHIDKDRQNNNIDNLQLMTHKQHNTHHAHAAWNKGKSGTNDIEAWHDKTVKSKHSNYIERTKETYRLRYAEGMSAKQIAILYGVSTRTIYLQIEDCRKEVMPICL